MGGGSGESTRREFLGQTGGVLAGAALAPRLDIARAAHVGGSDEVRIALVGCGGRGGGAALQAMNNAAGARVRLVALADAFGDRVESCHKALLAATGDDGRVDVPQERRFVGLDSFRQAIESDVHMVLLCTPPGPRPVHFETAVEAGKHVFMEKPVATDAPGVRRVMAANARAKEQGLLVAVGHHLRHEDKHRRIVEEIHGGALGELSYMRAYFNSGGVWVRRREPGQTEMQYQVRNWYYFTWMGGDHIVEQHVHDLDVCNWIQGGHPVQAQGMGGRQIRKGPEHGEIYDHHAVEFTYADGVKLFSFSRHMPGCWNSFAEHAHGAEGFASIEGHGPSLLQVAGREPQRWEREADGHQVEHDDLFAALLAGEPYNECDWAAESTMTAILGRMATYSGRVVDWDQAIASDLDLQPESWSWDAEAPLQPREDGTYACAVPGVTRAW